MPENHRKWEEGASNGTAQNYEFLNDLSSEELLYELEEKLEAMTDLNYDEELVDAYLSELNRKEPMELNIDVEASLAEFHAEHLFFIEDKNEREGSEHGSIPAFSKHRHILMRWISVAAICGILAGSMVAQATGYDMFRALISWTKETFYFEAQETQGEASRALPTGKTEYTSLQEALNDYGMPTWSLAPTKLPDGFTLGDLTINSNADRLKFQAQYQNGERVIMYIILHNLSEESAHSPIFEKDDNAIPEVYRKAGFDHYIVPNTDQLTARWVNGNDIISVTGNLTHDELIKMIDSVYK